MSQSACKLQVQIISVLRTQEQSDALLVRPHPRRERVGVVEPVERRRQVRLRAQGAGMDAVSSVISVLCTSMTTVQTEHQKNIELTMQPNIGCICKSA